MNDTSVLSIRNLSKTFSSQSGFFSRRQQQKFALDNVSFDLGPNETFGIVGESGCGKSTLGRTICRLYNPTAGTITLDGEDITLLKPHELKKHRRKIQMVFQDPNASLNPRLPIAKIVEEPFRLHGMGTAGERRTWASDLLESVGLDTAALSRYPHEFSGGQRQRIGIARALALNPKIMVCDEPVSALDVSVQAQVLNLLLTLQKQRQISYIFISHDLNIIRHMSDRVGVMFAGRIVETGNVQDVFIRPAHPYTRELLQALPASHPKMRKQRVGMNTNDSVKHLTQGCSFSPRCPHVQPICREKDIALRPVDASGRHKAACHLSGSF